MAIKAHLKTRPQVTCHTCIGDALVVCNGSIGGPPFIRQKVKLVFSLLLANWLTVDG